MISSFFELPLIYDIAIGFVAGLFVILLFIIDEPKNIHLMLCHSKHTSFKKISIRKKDGTHDTSYTKFCHTYDVANTFFLFTLISVYTVVLLTILV